MKCRLGLMSQIHKIGCTHTHTHTHSTALTFEFFFICHIRSSKLVFPQRQSWELGQVSVPAHKGLQSETTTQAMYVRIT